MTVIGNHGLSWEIDDVSHAAMCIRGDMVDLLPPCNVWPITHHIRIRHQRALARIVLVKLRQGLIREEP